MSSINEEPSPQIEEESQQNEEEYPQNEEASPQNEEASQQNEEASPQNEEATLSSPHPPNYEAYEAILEQERKNIVKKRRRQAVAEVRQRDLPASSSEEGPARKTRRVLPRRRRRVNRNQQELVPVQRHRRNLFGAYRDRSCLRRRREDYVDFVVPKLFDYEFNEHFRVSRKTMAQLQACFITSVEANNLVSIEHRADVPLKDYMMMFLWLLGGSKTFETVADVFEVALEDVISVIKVVIKFFVLYSKRLIIFPETKNEAHRHANYFRRIFEFPDTIGCLTTHYIPIKDPSSNRCHSTTVQVIFDARGRILNLYINSYENVHPRDMLEKSPIGKSLQKLCYKRYHIIADSNHYVRHWLLTPFKDATSSDEILFNTRHRAVMDSSLNAWKKMTIRFQQLTSTLLTTEYFSGVMIACCILQNICLDENDDFEFDIDFVDFLEYSLRPQPNVGVEPVNAIADIPDMRSLGQLKRRQTSHDMLL